VTTFQVSSPTPTGSAIVHNTGQEVPVTYSVQDGNGPGYTECDTADPDVTCRMISAAAGAVTLGITAGTGAMHGTRVVRLNNGAGTMHADIADAPPEGFGVSIDPPEITAGQWGVPARVTLTGFCDAVEYCDAGQVMLVDQMGNQVMWADFQPVAYGEVISGTLSPPLDTPAGQYGVTGDFCFDFYNPVEEWVGCKIGLATLTVDSPPPAPTLSCTPMANGAPTVTRGGALTCTVSGTTAANVSSWQFTGGGATVNGPAGTLTWSGAMAVSGTVKATLSSGSALQQGVTVQARTNFAFAAVTATKQPNPYSGGTCNIGVPTSPVAGNNLGYYCLDQEFSETPYLIGDSGPNNGYRYVYAATNSSSSGQTAFNYVIAGYLDDSAGQFAQMQCGNYNPVTNAGFISYAQLKSNTYEHESGNTTGHYAQYTSAQGASGNNVGVAMEAVVGPPGQSEADFNSAALATAAAKANVINTASDAEACNQDVRYDTSCVFRGFINWPVYASCQ
jgi:hypothetical protein